MVDSFSRMLLVVAEYYVGLWVDLSRNRFVLYFLGSVFSLHLTRCCKKGRFLSPLYNFSCKRLVIVVSVLGKRGMVQISAFLNGSALFSLFCFLTLCSIYKCALNTISLPCFSCVGDIFSSLILG